jgi:hypothetical protein
LCFTCIFSKKFFNSFKIFIFQVQRTPTRTTTTSPSRCRPSPAKVRWGSSASSRGLRCRFTASLKRTSSDQKFFSHTQVISFLLLEHGQTHSITYCKKKELKSKEGSWQRRLSFN